MYEETWETVYACVCISAALCCYPEHTVTLTWYHKEKKVAFCYLSLSAPPGDVRHTRYSSLLFSLSDLSVDRFSNVFLKCYFLKTECIPMRSCIKAAGSLSWNKQNQLLLFLKNKAADVLYFSCSREIPKKTKNNPVLVCFWILFPSANNVFVTSRTNKYFFV